MKHLASIILVGIGGSIGAAARYGITLLCHSLFAPFPLGTLLVNLGGCLTIGAIAGILDVSLAISPEVRLLLVTGFCGAFTTMSSYVYETDQLLKNGHLLLSAVYAAGTLLGSFMLFYAGHAAMKLLFR